LRIPHPTGRFRERLQADGLTRCAEDWTATSTWRAWNACWCWPGAALADERLDPRRFGHHLRLRREVAFEAARSDERLWQEREAKWRTISKLQKQLRKG
jgi:hypothetical protein